MGQRILRPTFAIALLLTAHLMTGVGCREEPDRGIDAAPTRSDAGNAILATVDAKAITADSVDIPLQLDLHDLDQAKYQRRLAGLRLRIAARIGADVIPGSPEWNTRVAIHLEPPSPPRLEIPDGDAPIRGAKKAPITIVEFVDFESAHCRRLQPDLMRMLERYPDRVRILVRDLPLPYHRNAWNSATATHCAAEQEAYWDYHDVLLVEQPNLSAAELSRYAENIGLDGDRFDACVDSNRHAARVTADVALAESLGIRRAATVFVNGLYLTGRPSFDEIDQIVRSELERLGIDSFPSPTKPTRPARGMNDDQASETPETREASRENRAALPEIPPELLSEPELVLTLSRDEVDRALADQKNLDRKLEASPGEFSGQRLLSIRTIDDGDFYTRLGLEESDVLLVVNGEFVTVDHPSFWDAFESGGKVTLLVMRRGRPHTYEYRIR